MTMHRLLALFLTLFLFAPAAAGISFKKLPLDLKNSYIRDIQRSSTALWLATSGGLVRYDLASQKIKTYTMAEGLPDDFVTSVEISIDEKTVWAGTPSGLAEIGSDDKITVYNRAGKQLSNDRVNALCLSRGYLYVGTQFGVDRLQLEQKTWAAYTAIEGLAGNNIQSIIADGDVLWAGGADGIAYYDRNFDLWFSFDSSNGLNSALVTSLAADADSIWVGTATGGLSRFDKLTQRFEPLTSEEGLVDDAVQTLVDDGNFLWVGTFDGLSRLDKKNLLFKNFHRADGFGVETSIVAGQIMGNEIYVAAGSDGLYLADKEIPEVSFLAKKTGYSQKGRLQVYANISSQRDIAEARLAFKLMEEAGQFEYNRVPADKNSWQPLPLAGKNSGTDLLLATLDTSAFKDGRYLLQIEARDSKGLENSSTGLLVVDNKAPELQLFLRAPRQGEKEVTVSGSYEELNLSRLSVKLGNRVVMASIDAQNRRFRFNYPVLSGASIVVEAEDIGKNVVILQQDYMVDRDPPDLQPDAVDKSKIISNIVELSGEVSDKNLDKVIIMPGNIEARLEPLSPDHFRFSARAPIKNEGVFIFQITAVDKGGRSTVKPVELRYISDITILQVDEEKIPAFTLRDAVELSGNILGPLPAEIFVEPGHIALPVKKDKSFSLKLPLSEGENTIELVATFEKGAPIRETFKIEASKKGASAHIDPGSRAFNRPEAMIRGRVDRGVSNVYINKLPVEINRENNTFVYSTTLKEGKNQLAFSVVDELKRVENFTETVYFDQAPPRIFLRSLPRQTGLESLSFQGRLLDLSPASIEAYPSVEIDQIQPESGEFSGHIYLRQGINRLFVKATDAAGNKAVKEYMIEMDPAFPRRETGDSTAEEFEALQEELARLKKELAEKPVAAARPAVSSSGFVAKTIPAKAGIYLMPLAGKTNSYQLAAKIYLGSESLADQVAAFNHRDAAGQTALLVPSPALYTLLGQSRYSHDYEQILRVAGGAYLRQSDSLAVEKEIMQYLLRNRQLLRAERKNGYSVFILKNGSGLIFNHNPQSPLKSMPKMAEIMVLAFSENGITMEKY